MYLLPLLPPLSQFFPAVDSPKGSLFQDGGLDGSLFMTGIMFLIKKLGGGLCA